MTDRVPLILDCDNTMGVPGRDVDDGLALLYLLGSPQVELLAVTCSFGNSTQEVVYRNTLDLLALARDGDEAATEEILRQNSGLIWAVVRRYYGRGVEPDDLYQLGCLGFLKAVRGFDLAYGTQFSTYAVPKIAGEIRRYLRDSGAVKVGRSIREQSLGIYTARERLRGQLGREPALSELSEATGLTPEEIAVAELATAAPDSLQQENGDGLTLESTLADSGSEEAMVERIALRSAIDRLPEQEKKTILLRFYKGLTQQQCARILSVSQVQVSRLEKRALEKLRREMG